MGSLLRSLVLGTILIPHLFVADAVAAPMGTSTCLTELSVDRSFQPEPPGVPQRRLSGGTR
ncbi:MAG: hypothetical protein AAF243_02770 [Cyanobacteria bacterium P01_A01_bin.137]